MIMPQTICLLRSLRILERGEKTRSVSRKVHAKKGDIMFSCMHQKFIRESDGDI